MKILEKDIQRSILDYLAYKNYFFWRNNNIPVFDPIGKRFRGMPKYSMLGIPDIILILKGGVVVFIEVKRKGGVLSEYQLAFQKKCEKVGAKYIIAFSLDDIVNAGL